MQIITFSCLRAQKKTIYIGFDNGLLIVVANGGSNRQRYKTHQGPKHRFRDTLNNYTQENEKGKVNQLDVGNRKIQNNYKTRTCV